MLPYEITALRLDTFYLRRPITIINNYCVAKQSRKLPVLTLSNLTLPQNVVKREMINPELGDNFRTYLTSYWNFIIRTDILKTVRVCKKLSVHFQYCFFIIIIIFVYWYKNR